MRPRRRDATLMERATGRRVHNLSAYADKAHVLKPNWRIEDCLVVEVTLQPTMPKQADGARQAWSVFELDFCSILDNFDLRRCPCSGALKKSCIAAEPSCRSVDRQEICSEPRQETTRLLKAVNRA